MNSKKKKAAQTKKTARKNKATLSAGKKVPPLIEQGDDEIVLPETLPVILSPDLVPFPSVMISLYLEHAQNVRAIEAAMERDQAVLIIAHKVGEIENVQTGSLFRVGIAAAVVKLLKLADGRYKALLQGKARARVVKYETQPGFINAQVEALFTLQNVSLSASDKKTLTRIRDNLQVLVQYEHLPEEMLIVTEELDEVGVLADVIIAHYKLDVDYAQSLLEELDPIKRLQATDKIIVDDLNQFLVAENIKDKTKDELGKGQREYYLKEQLKQIQRELGDDDSVSEDLLELKEALEDAKLPEHAFTFFK